MRGLAALIVVVACVALGRDAGAFDPAHLTLVDQRGTMFTLASLRGHPTVITFVATRCTDACPVSNAVFSQLSSRLEREHVAATLLTITLDPEYDTPFVMSQAAKEFSAHAPRWRFASGKPSDVHAFMGAFGVIAQRGREGFPDVHSSVIYILDARGAFSRATLLSTNSGDEIDSYLKQRRATR
jgi:protein SCO1/2